MKPLKPVLFADERGVWREDLPGRRFGIEGGEIWAIAGYTVGEYFDSVTVYHVVLELDFEFGEFLGLDEYWDGFGQVVDAITKRLPGVKPGWFETLKQMCKDDPIMVIWSKS